jgi:hypothetical protein
MGRPPDFNPHENEAVWQIVANAWIYVVADSDRAGKALLTLMGCGTDVSKCQVPFIIFFACRSVCPLLGGVPGST